MPMWKIYHPENAFSDEDKQQLAQNITQLYSSFLPKFYVNVFYHPITASTCYIGGQESNDFVRIAIDHIARSITSPEAQQQFLNGCTQILNPYVQERGYRWELHVNETSFELWTINGFKPPLPNTKAETKWKAENKPSAYDE
ncbi:tautomerase family protein [Acinetobacter calcoaceticus]|uniref:tautomerase family protein n=1 Tax=Acinetobacter calcoaceticus TaxID=471 RepID=UPI00190159C0|nr:tautomerase family protein [Acinetobacter calcoaceticus]MBJ9723330.1 tautomerase family protein [Acinetobacter calcoaceticus]